MHHLGDLGFILQFRNRWPSICIKSKYVLNKQARGNLSGLPRRGINASLTVTSRIVPVLSKIEFIQLVADSGGW